MEQQQDSHAELIAKLEASTEGSRELDCWIAVDPMTPKAGVVKGEGQKTVIILLEPNVLDDDGDRNADALGVPNYTTSIDAALTLVPEGWDASVHHHGASAPAGKRGGAVVRNPGRKHEPTFTSWKKATPALALAIAALRARFTEQERTR